MEGGGRRPPLPDKEFFTIGETCRIAQVPPHTLRYWETQFRLLRPVRRESGHRRFTRRDVETVLQIKDLLRNKRMTVSGARKVLARQWRGGRTAKDASRALPLSAIKLLREVRDEIRRIVSDLSR